MFENLLNGDDYRYQDRVSATASAADKLLLGAALTILFRNIDIANWAACLVNAWSPESTGLDYSGCLQGLMAQSGSGQLNLSVTWVESLGNASMAAWTEALPNSDGVPGLIIPIQLAWWAGRAATFGDSSASDPERFCAAATVASTILHEFIHICGDHGTVVSYGPYFLEVGAAAANVPGAQHEDDDLVANPCWDEPRMVGTIFRWALSQRYPCLDPSGECGHWYESDRFGHSTVFK